MMENWRFSSYPSWYMRNRLLLMLFGAVFGLLVPLGRLLYRAYTARQAWWDKWLTTEFKNHHETYIVVGVLSVIALAVVGYLMGLDHDRRTEESETARDTNLELTKQATTDPLTGLLNPRGINERLEIELANCGRIGLSCLIIDIDHFKRINDTHGHPFGDEVLVTVGGVLKRSVRRIDSVGRLGGEEFVILLPGISRDESLMVAERVRTAMQEEKIQLGDKKVSVTISIGAATFPAPGVKQKESLLQVADVALYKAKKSGRNRVVLYDHESLSSSDSNN